MSNMLDDLNRHIYGETLHKTAIINNAAPFSTPSKVGLVSEMENRNPKVIQPLIPFTPKTMTEPMMTANTPAPPLHATSLKVVDVGQEETEYSFEERRLGFMISQVDTGIAIMNA